jgi:hypothetical protein
MEIRYKDADLANGEMSASHIVRASGSRAARL